MDSEITLCTLQNHPNDSYRVKLYINGILVGDDMSGYSGGTNPTYNRVLTIGSNNEIKYNSVQNEGYKLKKGDKVMLYWFE